jgi:hypothetical protein
MPPGGGLRQGGGSGLGSLVGPSIPSVGGRWDSGGGNSIISAVGNRPVRKFPSDSPRDTRPRVAYSMGVQAESLEAFLDELDGELPPQGGGVVPPRGPGAGLRPAAQAARPEFPGPRKLNYTHEDCVEYIIRNPAVTQKELAQRYGYSEVWISRIIACDAFQAAVAKRRNEMLSPELVASAEENFKALVLKTQNYLLEQLHGPKVTPQLALGVLGTASKALGYGARAEKVENNTTFVVMLPAAAKSSEEWAKGHTIEHEPDGRSLSRVPALPPSEPTEA